VEARFFFYIDGVSSIPLYKFSGHTRTRTHTHTHTRARAHTHARSIYARARLVYLYT